MKNKYFVYSAVDQKIFCFTSKKKAGAKFNELLVDNAVLLLSRKDLQIFVDAFNS